MFSVMSEFPSDMFPSCFSHCIPFPCDIFTFIYPFLFRISLRNVYTSNMSVNVQDFRSKRFAFFYIHVFVTCSASLCSTLTGLVFTYRYQWLSREITLALKPLRVGRHKRFFHQTGPFLPVLCFSHRISQFQACPVSDFVIPPLLLPAYSSPSFDCACMMVSCRQTCGVV